MEKEKKAAALGSVFDFAAFEKEAVKQLKSGKPLSGNGRFGRTAIGNIKSVTSVILHGMWIMFIEIRLSMVT